MGLLAATILFDSLTNFGLASDILARVLYVTVFVGAAFAAELSSQWRRTAIAWILIWQVTTALDIAVRWPTTGAIEIAVLAILLLGTLLIVFREASREDGLRADAVPASIFGYLLLTLTFALFYVKLEAIWPGSFDLGRSDVSVSSLLYFSLVIITTLGLGDITPISRPAQIVVGIEAAVGVMYVAIFIGRLIGKR